MERLKGKRNLVTGGAAGIGRAACLRLAQEDARVAVTDCDDERGEAVAAAIRDAGGEARYWHLDVRREAEVRQVVDDVHGTFGGLDVVVNNAGIAGTSKPTHEITEAEWDALMAVNVKGVFFCTKHAVPWLIEAGGGSIINLSSIYGLVGAPDAPPYHASKGAVRLMTKTDALLYAPHRVRVNSVHPGFIRTPMLEHHLETLPDPDATLEALAAKHPIGHLGEADDVAWAIVYLASDESKFVTGAELVVDGGYTAQ